MEALESSTTSDTPETEKSPIMPMDAGPKVILIKRWDEDEFDTIGGMYDDGKLFCITLELPNRGNQHNISRILAGSYDMHLAQHHGDLVWELENVRSNLGDLRDGVRIHSANKVSELLGCIAVGYHLALLRSRTEEVYESKLAFHDLMDRTKGLSKAKLIIEDIK